MVKKTIVIAPIAVALTLAALAFALRMVGSSVQLSESRLSIGGAVLTVEVADTLAQQVRGLSGRESLDQDRGMLFVYPDKRIRNFWMKDMRFLIDVVWIADGKVVGIGENIPFQSDDGEVVRFTSDALADMALEVNAGWVAEHGVSVGDSASLDAPSD